MRATSAVLALLATLVSCYAVRENLVRPPENPASPSWDTPVSYEVLDDSGGFGRYVGWALEEYEDHLQPAPPRQMYHLRIHASMTYRSSLPVMAGKSFLFAVTLGLFPIWQRERYSMSAQLYLDETHLDTYEYREEVVRFFGWLVLPLTPFAYLSVNHLVFIENDMVACLVDQLSKDIPAQAVD